MSSVDGIWTPLGASELDRRYSVRAYPFRTTSVDAAPGLGKVGSRAILIVDRRGKCPGGEVRASEAQSLVAPNVRVTGSSGLVRD